MIPIPLLLLFEQAELTEAMASGIMIRRRCCTTTTTTTTNGTAIRAAGADGGDG